MSTTETLGGEVIMHPGPKKSSEGTRPEHGSHKVQSGYGGNDVIIQGGPPVLTKDSPLGSHNTEVSSEPGNVVVMHAGPSGNQAEDAESLLDPMPSSYPPNGPTDEQLAEVEYAELLSQVSAHSREAMEGIAENMELKFAKGLDDAELAAQITTGILKSQKQIDAAKEGDSE